MADIGDDSRSQHVLITPIVTANRGYFRQKCTGLFALVLGPDARQASGGFDLEERGLDL